MAWLAASAALAACSSVEKPAADGQARVDAARHDAFWLWAGVDPPPLLAQARTLYILEAEYLASADGRWQSRRAATPRAPHATLWIVYRVESLRWPERLYARLSTDLARYRAAGNRVAGIQIDFDANTRYLDEYAVFLRDLRRRLPRDAQLSITGLMDWGAQADPEALNALGSAIDELVVQTYQGRHSIPDAHAYARSLERLRQPFRVGLVQHGLWREPDNLRRNPYFRGYVVFLVNDRENGAAGED